MRSNLDILAMPEAPDFRASTILPLIFAGTKEEQQSRWNAVPEKIEVVEKQDKLIKGSIIGVPYSVFCFEDNQGEIHYYLVPRTFRKEMNTLGKGSQGYVIPGYELIRREDGTYLSRDDLPDLAIKIIKCNSIEELEKKSKDAKRQVKAIKRGYRKKLKILPTPFERVVGSREETSYKIYLAMSYVPGINGGDFIELQKKQFKTIQDMPEKQKNKYYLRLFLEALGYCISVMEEVNAFLKKGYLHRDIKPQNFILREGAATLIDFGFADTAKRIANEKRLCGAMGFYAPEFFNDNNIRHTEQCEKFSLGVTLYDFLGGQEKESERIDQLYEKLNNLSKNGVMSINEKKEKELELYRELYSILEKGSDRMADDFLSHVPIHFEQIACIKEKIAGLMNVDPAKRPAIIEVKEAFERIKQDILDHLTEEAILEDTRFTGLWLEIENWPLSQVDEPRRGLNTSDKGKEEADELPPDENDVKKPSVCIADFYLGLYQDKHLGKEEFDRMKIGSLQNDQLNYLCHLISQDQVDINSKTRENIISSLARFFNLSFENESEKIQGIIEAVNAKNAELSIVSRWQYVRIMKKYIDYKNSTFMGLGWYFQSEETEEAIYKAEGSKSPEERGRALIQHYYQAANPGTFFHKSNKERALGKCISAIRPTMPRA